MLLLYISLLFIRKECSTAVIPDATNINPEFWIKLANKVAKDSSNALNGIVATSALITYTVIDGASLAGSNIQEMTQQSPTARSCAIQIRNFHKDLELTEPEVFVERGYIHLPPAPVIEPGFSEACMFRKTYGPATGTYGVLTYKIVKLNAKNNRTTTETDGSTLTIMWGVPWSWEWRKNYHAIGVAENQPKMNYDLFDKMFYKKGTFIRKQGGKPISYQETVYGNIPLNIISTMNDESLATLIVDFR